MKAVYLSDIRKFEIRDIAQPEIKNNHDVLIKITHVTICGSDVHYYNQGKIGSQVVKFPFILGHECAGIVIKTGDKVTRVKTGDKIAIDPAVSCYDCDQCKSGRPHTCRNLKFLGCPDQLEGSLQEFIVMPEQSCYPVKENTTLVDAALSEPFSIGLYSIKRGNPKSGDKIAIFGYGPIGMSVMLAGKAKGFSDFYIIDRIEERLRIAKEEGAKVVLKFSSNTTARQLFSVEKDGMDIVYDCCGQQEAVDEALNVLKPGGKLVIVGIPEFDYWKFQSDILRRKEITIINIRRQNECVQEALDLIEEGKVSLKRMPTHFFDIQQTAIAFKWVENYRDGVMKAVLNFE